MAVDTRHYCMLHFNQVLPLLFHEYEIYGQQKADKCSQVVPVQGFTCKQDFGKDGKNVSKEKYEKQCGTTPTYKCVEKNGKFYDKNGNVDTNNWDITISKTTGLTYQKSKNGTDWFAEGITGSVK